MRKHALYGAGGMAHDIRALIGEPNLLCFVDEEYCDGTDETVVPIRYFDPRYFELVIAVADPWEREKMVKRLPADTKYWSFIHPSAQFLDGRIKIGTGTVIGANCVIVYLNSIGNHSYINMSCVLGHDSVLGDFCTMSPMAGVMGNCKIGNRVYIGCGAMVKQKVSICDDVTVGMSSCVLHDIRQPGTYVGSPAKRLGK